MTDWEQVQTNKNMKPEPMRCKPGDIYKPDVHQAWNGPRHEYCRRMFSFDSDLCLRNAEPDLHLPADMLIWESIFRISLRWLHGVCAKQGLALQMCTDALIWYPHPFT